MTDYSIFGGFLRSTLEFPELPTVTVEEPTWTLSQAPTDPAPEVGDPLGEDVVTGDVRVRAYRQPDGVALVYDDTGRFDISGDGRRVTWRGGVDVPKEAVRADVIGRVLPMALHVSGVLTLHASGVVIAGTGIAFVAPKYHGKSSLALALIGSGARLLTDDVLPVELSDPPRACAGVHALRLWRDSAEQLMGPDGEDPAAPDAKLILDSLDDRMLQREAVPFGAAYVLTPVLESDSDVVAARTPLSQIEATLALIRHARVAPLLSGTEAGSLFSLAAALAARTRVYTLHVARDLRRLQEVAATVHAWHGR